MFGNSLSKENKNNFLSKILAPSPVLWYPFFEQLSCCSNDLTYTKNCDTTILGVVAPLALVCQDDNAFRKRFH
jgi:hypothetical protein